MPATPEQLVEALALVGVEDPAELLDAIVNTEINRRHPAREKANEERRAGRRAANPQPNAGLFARVPAGRYQRPYRPPTSPDDRRYVPAALKHWRTVHGLSQAQAQARIGYSA